MDNCLQLRTWNHLIVFPTCRRFLKFRRSATSFIQVRYAHSTHAVFGQDGDLRYPLLVEWDGEVWEFVDGLGLCSCNRWRPDARGRSLGTKAKILSSQLHALMFDFVVEQLGDLRLAGMKLAFHLSNVRHWKVWGRSGLNCWRSPFLQWWWRRDNLSCWIWWLRRWIGEFWLLSQTRLPLGFL